MTWMDMFPEAEAFGLLALGLIFHIDQLFAMKEKKKRMTTIEKYTTTLDTAGFERLQIRIRNKRKIVINLAKKISR